MFTRRQCARRSARIAVLLKTESRRGYRLLGDWTVRPHDAAKPAGRPAADTGDRRSSGDQFPRCRHAPRWPIGAVQRLHDLVSAYRVVTLTGPGGIGKTTLALKVARRVLGEFADGGWLVELASLSDPHLVPSAVAGVLGLRLGSEVHSAEAVARAVGGKKLLLVLDNCEHVIDAAATLAEMFVRLCPRDHDPGDEPRVASGSRASTPIACRRLKCRRTTSLKRTKFWATAHRNSSSPEPASLVRTSASRAENLPTIAAICRQLDGIPLAIEFAAARAATLGIEQVAAGLRDRFALLTNGAPHRAPTAPDAPRNPRLEL